MKVLAALCLVAAPLAGAFVVPMPASTTSSSSTTKLSAEGGMSRRDALFKATASAALFTLGLTATTSGGARAESLPSGITYTVIEKGTGPKPEVGELAAIRFTGAYKDVVFDNLYDTKEPLYFRVGGGTLLKGIEEAVKAMQVGDRWKLTIPGELAFGAKGRSASPGKPRIPPMAAVEYDLKLVAIPGRETEIIDLADFDENAPASDDSDPNKGLRF